MGNGWKATGLIAAGFAIGTAGVAFLSSKDAKKAYTHITAAALRCKDEILKRSSILKENCQDIAADAQEINEKRQAEADAQEIADAKEILDRAKEAAKEAAAEA